MVRIRTFSHAKVFSEWRTIKLEEDSAERQILWRMFWTGPQDFDSCSDYRFAQLLGFGLLDPAEVERGIARLEEMGWLASPEVAAAQDPNSVPSTAATITARAHTTSIARLAESIGGDIGAMGPWLLAKDPTIAERLAGIQRELEAMAADLRATRKPFLDEQLQRLGVAPGTHTKLHLGAGLTKLEGWINCDVFPSQLALNLAWKLPFEDNSLEFVFAGHVFEHLYYGAEALALLREIQRVLKPGGVFRFIVPNVGLFLRKYAENDREFFEEWRLNKVGAGAPYFRCFKTPMELIMAYCFVGRDPGDFFGHKMGYDLETCEHIGKLAEFSSVQASDYMQSAYPELRIDEISVAARLTYKEERYSLFIEMTK